MLYRITSPIRTRRKHQQENQTTPEERPTHDDTYGRHADGSPAGSAGFRVLVVDGRSDESLARLLSRDGHDVLSADAPTPAIRLLSVFDAKVIVVVGDSCRELRLAAPDAGIIALIRGQGAVERLAALDAGADDCMTWPWNDLELRARVRAMGRRRGGHTEVSLR